MLFPTTQWSLLAKATLHGDAEARAALGELCRRYWTPLHRFIVARGYSEAEAEDLTQEFLVHLMSRSTLRKPDPLRGKFRSFLLGALANFLSHERDRKLTQKRGGQAPHVNVSALSDPDDGPLLEVRAEEASAFDRAWALALLRAALEKLRHDYAASGKEQLFEIVRAFLPGGSVPPTYEEAAGHAGLSVPALNSEIHRLRRHFRENVYAEIARTVSAPHEIEEELTHLYQVLMDRGTDFRSVAES